MKTLTVEGVRLEGVYACVPRTRATNSPELAETTGIRERRIAADGTSPLDLSLAAAKRLMADLDLGPADIGAVVSVSFTQAKRMPASAVEAQSRLGLATDTLAFDVMLACSGYGYGLYLAALLARQTGRRTLLLDGDVQSAFLAPGDKATTPVMADGGTASVIAPDGSDVWRFAFMSDGAKGAALELPTGGHIAMDGFGVFSFVATDVVRFLNEFLAATSVAPADLDAFVPHQANVYMITQLAKSLGIDRAKLKVSCDELGNLSSASVPATLALRGAAGRTLLAGFGGGLSASAALLNLDSACRFACFDDEK